MNIILQNVVASVSAVSITVAGMVGIESRYIDEGEAGRLYQSKLIAQQRYTAQIAVNTTVAATLIDLRIRQYQYTADTTKSPVERDAMLEQMRIAKAELRKLGNTYSAAITLMPLQVAPIAGSD